MPSQSIFPSVILLILTLSFSNTSLFSTILKENLVRYFGRPLLTRHLVNDPFRFRWAPGHSSRFLFSVPFGQQLVDPFGHPLISNAGLQPITRSPIINWKPLNSERLIEESSKSVPDIIVGKNIDQIKSIKGYAEDYSKDSPKLDVSHQKIVHNWHEKVAVTKPLSHLNNKNNSKNEEINYESIVNNLQNNILKNMSLIIEKTDPKEKNKTHIDFKHIVKNLQQKQLNMIYNQEKVFNPKYEYGFKPLEPNKNSLQRQIKTYLQFINDQNKNNDFDNRNDRKDKSTKSNHYYSKYVETNMTESSHSKNEATKALAQNHSKKSTNFSNNQNSKTLFGYEVDFHNNGFQPGSNLELIKENFNSISNDYVNYDRMKQSKPNDFLSKHPDLTQFKSSGLECAQEFGWCDYNHDYPIDYIEKIAGNCSQQLSMMYIEIPENLSDFDGYAQFSEINANSKKVKKKKSLCNSDRKFIRPSVGQDINGNYYIIVQTSFYYQQIPVEICKNPGSFCSGIENCGVNVRCTQKYRTHLLISVNSNNIQECPQMRLYRLPTACVCETSIHN